MDPKPLFQVGDKVWVRDLEAEDGLSGHMRAPLYCRNKLGEVERCCGVFKNPESLAYAGDGKPKQPLYRVRFKLTELWPDDTALPKDTVEIELYQHWLTHHAS